MKKKLISCVSLVIILILCMSVATSAITYDCNVRISSKTLLLVNLETNTTVFDQDSYKKRYFSYLSDIMTAMVVIQSVDNPEKETVKIDTDVLDSDPEDTPLEPYVGEELTVKDLLYIMMMTGDRNSAILLADYVSKGKIDDFVDLMNEKAEELGCDDTYFISPAATSSSSQYTTCNDLKKIILWAFKSTLFKDTFTAETYLPDGDKNDDHTITTTNSLKVPTSPYYFRYTFGGKFGRDSESGSNLIATFKYGGVRYLFIGFGASTESERNVFVDAKQMATWAYTKLATKKILSANTPLATATADSKWGSSTINLIVKDDIYKTVPKDVANKDVYYEVDVPEKVNLPVFVGQNIGTVSVYYKDEPLGESNLVSQSSEGVNMFDDIGDFLRDAYSNLLPYAPGENDKEELSQSTPDDETVEQTTAQSEETKAENSDDEED